MDVTPDTPFNDVFPDTKNPYTRQILDQIVHNRSKLDGELFFDHLLISFARVHDVTQHYPPRSITSLKSLYTTIITNPHLDAMKRHSLLYYLLLDLPGGSAAASFSERIKFPHNFRDLITALHHLDNLKLLEAMPFLTSPAISLPQPEKILKILYHQGNAASTTGVPGPSGASLAVTFMSIVSPVLESPESIELYFIAQMQLSPEGAFLYTRTGVPGYLKTPFLKRLIQFCLTTNPAVNAMKLINLPFDKEEKRIFVEALEESREPIAKDTKVLWEMHQGRMKQAEEGARSAKMRGQIDGLDWKVLGEGLRKGMGGR
ncbi:nuclear pore complex assembly-domain-containing protein, partial [Pyronema omphalodes]